MDLPEILFIIIRTTEFGVLLDFNMFQCEDNSVSLLLPKTLVRAALSAYYITLLSSKGNGNRVDLPEILFIKFAQLNLVFYSISTCSGVKITASASHSPKR